MKQGLVHISDLHLAEHSQDQDDMADAMILFFGRIFSKTVPKVTPLKAVFVDGDMLDHAIRLYQPSFKAFLKVCRFLLQYCEAHNVVLRILNGTWEHDHGQLAYMNELKEGMAPGCNFAVIDQITLEYIPELDIRVLYLPDDLPYDSAQAIIDVVKEKMAVMGWDYVDYANVHGFFDFTVPPVARAAQKVVYTEAMFSFVRKGINAGHVHLHQKCGKVISNGNVDRIRFGETGPKGAVLVIDEIGGSGTSSMFLENPYAAPYDTLTFDSTMDTTAIVKDIADHVKSIKTTRIIHLRVLIENKDLRQAIRTHLLDTYPHIRSKVAAPPSEKKSSDEAVADSHGYTVDLPPMPTPHTLSEFIYNRVSAKDATIMQDDVTWALQSRPK